MTPKSAQKLRPKMRKNAQNGQNSAQTHFLISDFYAYF
nr:MAG TPA: hypothetical protein [Caudoviricetes sp.]